MTDQNQPIDYGSNFSIKVDYDGSDGLEVTHVDAERIKAMPKSGQLPTLEAYVEHMRANGYEPAHKLPELGWQWKSATHAAGKTVFFRRVDAVKATPGEIALALVNGAKPEPPTRTAEAKKSADANMLRFIRKAF